MQWEDKERQGSRAQCVGRLEEQPATLAIKLHVISMSLVDN